MSKDYSKTNILFLFWGRRGGGARYSYEISRELSLREDVNLFLSISNQCDLIDKFRNLNCLGLFVDTYENVPGFIYKWIFQRHKYRKQLTSFLIENRIDLIIIGMDFFWGDVIYKSARQAGAKTIFVVHEPKPHSGEPFFMGLVKKQTLKTLISGADHLVSLTDNVKKYLQNHYSLPESKISVIPHGVFTYYKADEPKLLPEKNKGRIILLYFGAITHYKGLDILLKAFRILEEKKLPVKLEIWGSGDLSKYETLLSELDRVYIENRWIDESEVGDVFKRSHICVLPYREVSQSGIVGAASRAALPMVACPAKGLKEQMGADEIYFAEDFTPESLADAIEDLVKQPDLYSDISLRLMEEAGKLEWSNIANDFKKVGDKLL